MKNQAKQHCMGSWTQARLMHRQTRHIPSSLHCHRVQSFPSGHIPIPIPAPIRSLDALGRVLLSKYSNSSILTQFSFNHWTAMMSNTKQTRRHICITILFIRRVIDYKAGRDLRRSSGIAPCTKQKR